MRKASEEIKLLNEVTHALAAAGWEKEEIDRFRTLRAKFLIARDRAVYILTAEGFCPEQIAVLLRLPLKEVKARLRDKTSILFLWPRPEELEVS